MTVKTRLSSRPGALSENSLRPGESSAGASIVTRVRLQSMDRDVHFTRCVTSITSIISAPKVAATSASLASCGKLATTNDTRDCSASERPAASTTVGTSADEVDTSLDANPSYTRKFSIVALFSRKAPATLTATLILTVYIPSSRPVGVSTLSCTSSSPSGATAPSRTNPTNSVLSASRTRDTLTDTYASGKFLSAMTGSFCSCLAMPRGASSGSSAVASRHTN